VFQKDEKPPQKKGHILPSKKREERDLKARNGGRVEKKINGRGKFTTEWQGKKPRSRTEVAKNVQKTDDRGKMNKKKIIMERYIVNNNYCGRSPNCEPIFPKQELGGKRGERRGMRGCATKKKRRPHLSRGIQLIWEAMFIDVERRGAQETVVIILSKTEDLIPLANPYIRVARGENGCEIVVGGPQPRER